MNNSNSRKRSKGTKSKGSISVQNENIGTRRCGEVSVPVGGTSLAMVYAVPQCWENINISMEGLDRGTIFDDLHKPFEGDTCRRGGCR